MALDSIRKLVGENLDEVDALLDALMEEIDEAYTKKWMKYFMQAKGNRLRPIMVFLSYRCFMPFEKENKDLIKVAAAIELLHTASLIHDDVIDEEQIRRDQTALNRVKGNKTSILVGNVFYLKAFELASTLPHMDYFLKMVRTSMEMCFGEVIQSEIGSTFLDKKSYLDIIQRKTARLMALSCRAGAMLAGASEEQMEQMEALGLIIGSMYQMRDDKKDWDIQLSEDLDLDELAEEFHVKFRSLTHDLKGEKHFIEALLQLEALIRPLKKITCVQS